MKHSEHIFIFVKYLYWIWLFVCFLFWFSLIINYLGFHSLAFNDLIDFLFNWGNFFGADFGSFIFISPLCIIIVFIIVSIIRKRVSVWESVIICIIWCMVIYIFPHLRG
jgi:hypothetical protein